MADIKSALEDALLISELKELAEQDSFDFNILENEIEIIDKESGKRVALASQNKDEVFYKDRMLEVNFYDLPFNTTKVTVKG